MNRDKIVRLVALIVLCGLVYYFSFDQGRTAQQPRMARLQEALIAKDRSIQALTVEVGRLKQQLLDCRNGSTDVNEEPLPSENGDLRSTLRLKESRTLFDGRLVLTCLGIDRGQRLAQIQFNKVLEDELFTEEVGLGQSVKFTLETRDYSLILDRLHSSFVAVQIVPR